MNRTVKVASVLGVTENTTKAFHYETAEGLRAHVLAFATAYNFASTSKHFDGVYPP